MVMNAGLTNEELEGGRGMRRLYRGDRGDRPHRLIYCTSSGKLAATPVTGKTLTAIKGARELDKFCQQTGKTY